MKKIALTFDDGPNNTVTPLILDLLEEYGAKATFFLIGEKISDETAKVMRRTVKMGCEIENHSFTHTAMTELSEEDRRTEIEKTSELIKKYTKTKVCFFRPPYIAMNEEVAKDIDYPLICGEGCDDWDENVSAETRIKAVLGNACDGQIVLLHDTYYNYKTYEALKTIVPELIARGYELVTLNELFASYGVAPEARTGRMYSRIEKEEDHNRFPKMALINDLSGFGRCSLTVQLPIVSALGIQGCVLPTAIFSNHTAYDSFFYEDYTDKMEAYIAEWEKLGLEFQGICTGFLGSEHQIDIVRDFIKKFKKNDTKVIVDPVMGDDGVIYSTYNEEMCRRLEELLPFADIVTPNLTEACILSGEEYREYTDKVKLLEIAEKIAAKGPKKIVITGIAKEPYISNFWYENGKYGFVNGRKIGCRRAGTGDVFSSLIAGYAVRGDDFVRSVKKTTTVLEHCMEKSTELGLPLPDGVCFEAVMKEL